MINQSLNVELTIVVMINKKLDMNNVYKLKKLSSKGAR